MRMGSAHKISGDSHQQLDVNFAEKLIHEIIKVSFFDLFVILDIFWLKIRLYCVFLLSPPCGGVD